MKKSTAKATKSSVPVKAAAPAKKVPAKTTVKKPVAVIKAKRLPATPVVKKTPVTKGPVTKIAPAVKAPAPVVTTVIIAQIDVGFGNTLFIRGEGAGLSWETGAVLTPVAADQWSITLSAGAKPLVYKFLLNDLVWSTGDDFVSAPGKAVTHTPSF